MRKFLVTGLLLLAGCAGNDPPRYHHGPPGHGGIRGRAGEAAGPRGRLFLSPMGEPFRSARGGPDPEQMWFDQADANHDGALSRAEFEADAKRFFALLDRGHDGEIDPQDIDYYETVLAPEIRVAGAAGGGRSAGSGHGGARRSGGMGGMGGGRRGGGGMRSGGEGGGSEGGSATQPGYGRQGAARYSYFDYPEPVTVADTNFNRGVDQGEFERAADARFALLDKNGDGRIERKELPHIATVPAWGEGRGRGRSHGAPGIDPTAGQPNSSP